MKVRFLAPLITSALPPHFFVLSQFVPQITGGVFRSVPLFKVRMVLPWALPDSSLASIRFTPDYFRF